MLHLDEAEACVRALIGTYGAGYVLDPRRTIERPWGWSFGWNTAATVAGEEADSLSGNGPILVDRVDGSVLARGSRMPDEAWVDEYDRELARRGSLLGTFLRGFRAPPARPPRLPRDPDEVRFDPAAARDGSFIADLALAGGVVVRDVAFDVRSGLAVAVVGVSDPAEIPWGAETEAVLRFEGAGAAPVGESVRAAFAARRAGR